MARCLATTEKHHPYGCVVVKNGRPSAAVTAGAIPATSAVHAVIGDSPEFFGNRSPLKSGNSTRKPWRFRHTCLETRSLGCLLAGKAPAGPTAPHVNGRQLVHPPIFPKTPPSRRLPTDHCRKPSKLKSQLATSTSGRFWSGFSGIYSREAQTLPVPSGVVILNAGDRDDDRTCRT